MDLTSKNVVLDAKLNARIIDFGLSREMDQGSSDTKNTTSKKFGTPGYMQTSDINFLTTKDDYYNYGVVIRELLTGEPPTDKHNPMLKDMALATVKIKIQSEIWGKERKEADRLNDLSKGCLDKEANLCVKGLLLDLMKNDPKWTPILSHKCEMCMVNDAAKDSQDILMHARNCTCKILVCVACMRNSYLNPIVCHTCYQELYPIIGNGWGAILIASNHTENGEQELAQGFVEDITTVHDVITSKCPLVMGISTEYVEMISPEKPGEVEDLMPKFDSAVENLKKKGDIHTLLIYFSGHHYTDKGFVLGHSEECLTVKYLRQKMHEIIYQYTADSQRTHHFSERRLIAFLDCCEAPDLTEPSSNEDNSQKETKLKHSISILQINSSRKTQTTKGSRKGSEFSKLFAQCFTQRALETPCAKENCHYCKFTNDFITLDDVHRYIQNHSDQMSVSKPVKSEKSTLSGDSIIGYNVNFKVAIEVKIKGSNEKMQVSPKVYSDLQQLKRDLLDKIISEQKQNLLFNGDDEMLLSFIDCICFEIEKGSKRTIELDKFDKLMTAWNSKRDIIISMRTSENIDRGRVLVHTNSEQTRTIKACVAERTLKRESLNTHETYSLRLEELTEWLIDMTNTAQPLAEQILQTNLTSVHTCLFTVQKRFDVNDKTVEIHFLFPTILKENTVEEQVGICFEVHGLIEKNMLS